MKRNIQPKVTDFLKPTNQNKSTLIDLETCATTEQNERCKASSKQVVAKSAHDSISCANSNFPNGAGEVKPNADTAPSDISPLTAIERSVTSLSLKTFKFPKTKSRAFKLSWLERFEWLEYSVSRNAAYCFACRQFDINGNKELAFKVSGFSSWKHAIEKNSGLVRHEKTTTHIAAMLSWEERKTRNANKSEISELVSSCVLEKRRFYMKTMTEILIFLISNEVAIRGSWDIENHKEDGVFRNLFDFELSHNKELKECAAFMPKNATYLSPDIQNELIWTITEIVRQKIVDDVLSADTDFYTVLVDGTKDRTNKEILSIALRYVKNGKALESLLTFETTSKFDAETQAELILKCLKKYGLDVLYILSQCYDGANVMSGDHGGIQRIIQDKLGRIIPYVHCFNHRLHLVIIAIIQNIEMARIFFDNIKLIYKFFHRAKIQSLYNGSSVLNLIETRWDGHVRATNVVYENYDEIIKTLPKVTTNTSYNFDADDIALASGILTAMKKPEFIFMLAFMKTFMNTISPVDKILQSRDLGYREAIPVIESVMSEIQNLRSLKSFEELWDECEDKFDLQVRPSREKRKPKTLESYIITDRIGERNPDFKIEIQSTYFRVIDEFSSEMKKRFSDNSDILIAISDAKDLCYDQLKPLKKIGIKLPPKEELLVAKTYIQRKREQFEDERKKNGDERFSTRFNLLMELYLKRDVFPEVYRFMATVDTFGCSTCICECSFSAKERIGIPSRLCMTNERLRNLSFLAFESKRLSQIDVEEVLKDFNANPKRRIQLY